MIDFRNRHTEITAFLASLCKVIGIFQSHTIPPNINLRNPNPAILWDQYNLHAPVVPTVLPIHSESGRALVSIASSGIGGSNGHCVVEEPPERPSLDGQSPLVQGPVLLMVGALSPRATEPLSKSFYNVCKEHPNDAAALSTLLGRRIRQMTWRSFTIADPISGLGSQFTPPAFVRRNKPSVGFVFSGQGPQHLASKSTSS